MLRVYHLLIGAVLLVLIPVGAKFVLPQLSREQVTTSNNVTTPTPTATSPTTPPSNPNARAENTWQKLLGKTSSPNGWEVLPCKDNVSLLCVSANGKLLGTVEMGIYPVTNNPDFQKHLTEVGIPFGSPVDLQNPEYQNKVIKALQAWVADLYSTITKDRQAAKAEKIILSTYPPQQTTIGELPALRYGFVGIKPDGGVQEQQIGHVTYDGKQLYVITTSFDPGSVTGSFDKLENLAIFQPYFYAIAENLNLPKQKGSSQP